MDGFKDVLDFATILVMVAETKQACKNLSLKPNQHRELCNMIEATLATWLQGRGFVLSKTPTGRYRAKPE